MLIKLLLQFRDTLYPVNELYDLIHVDSRHNPHKRIVTILVFPAAQKIVVVDFPASHDA